MNISLNVPKSIIDSKLRSGLNDMSAGRVYPADEVFSEIERRHIISYTLDATLLRS